VKLAYLSLGSNLGDRAAYIERALELLSGPGLKIVRRSAFYETEPRDLKAQPWFLNIAAEIETALFPRQLLARAARVEKELGRQRNVDKGPRTIDIDILLFGRFVVDAPDLVIPHPRMHERRFVLEPLAELVPELRHPVFKKTVREILATVKDQVVRRLE
jgi:2-amino-4-hydroxy-6-hydroxymethyldihydropteridine diphosphokinase